MNIKRSIRKRLDRLFKTVGLQAIKKADPGISNLYNTNYEKTALVSYLTAPFRNASDFKHQNYITCHIITESFRDLGYNVDVIDFNEDLFDLDYSRYAVILGFGINFERSFFSLKRDIPRIHFITGAHRELHNKMALKSIIDFQKISGLWLAVDANVSPEISYMSCYNADAAIILAQGYVLEDCRSRFQNQVYSLRNNILGTFSHFDEKKLRKPNFLFLSGGFLVTKGLPLFLEVAKIRKDLNFYIIIPYLNEELGVYYHDILKESDHVFLYEQLRMDSAEMKEIIELCNYSVAPSYIDGLPGGTIEPMSSGLIPIVSKYCGFEAKDFIFEIKELSVEGLNDAINEVLKLDDATYFEYSRAVKEYTNEYFSAPNVKPQLKKILEMELNK